MDMKSLLKTKLNLVQDEELSKVIKQVIWSQKKKARRAEGINILADYLTSTYGVNPLYGGR